MVCLKDIQACNAQLSANNAPRVAVFAGGTSGIGKATIKRLVALGFPVKVYIIGRPSTEEAMKPFIKELQESNPKADLRWIPGEISLLSEVKRISEDIKKAETNLDLLFLSAGYAPFGGRNNTSEGLETTHALQYYGRILFTQHLLPLLRKGRHPRVVSVLSGNILPKTFNDDDLNLEKPGAFGAIASQTNMGTMNCFGLDHLATDKENASITFIHDWPGAVDTGNMARYHQPSLFSPLPLTTLLKPIFWIMGVSFDETAERHLYLCTSGNFGGEGPKCGSWEAMNTARGTKGGLFLVDDKCQGFFDDSLFKKLKEQSGEKIWSKTTEILAPFS